MADELERLKSWLWHGNVFRALQTIEDLEIDIGVEHASPEQRKLLEAVSEFAGTSAPTPRASPTKASAKAMARPT